MSEYLSEYPLTYHEIETARIVRVKRVTRCDFVVVDPITGLKEFLNSGQMRKRFKADVRNANVRKDIFRKSQAVFC